MKHQARPLAMGRLALAVAELLVGMPVLVWFSFLRETPSFWTHAGGYPVWLRDVVLFLYYPLLLANLMATVLYVHLLISSPPPAAWARRVEISLFLLMLGALTVALAIDLVELE